MIIIVTGVGVYIYKKKKAGTAVIPISFTPALPPPPPQLSTGQISLVPDPITDIPHTNIDNPVERNTVTTPETPDKVSGKAAHTHSEWFYDTKTQKCRYLGCNCPIAP